VIQILVLMTECRETKNGLIEAYAYVLQSSGS